MPKFDSQTAREAGKKSRKNPSPRKKQYELLLDEIGDKITAKDLWEDIKAIKDPKERVKAKLAILEFRVAKPKQLDVKIDPSEGYIIGGLIPPKHEFSG